MTEIMMHHDVQLSPDGSILSISVPMTFRKRGGRKVVISPAGAPPQASLSHWAKPRSGVDEALVKTLAQAFQFQQLMDAGHYATISDLAKAKKLDVSFVSRTLRLTLLSPDIVESILDGSQSPAMQRQKLLHGFPLKWDEQRALAEG